MLYKIDAHRELNKVENVNPSEIGLTENHIVELYANHLNSTASNDELMLIGKSGPLQEEADLFALDRDGVLYIFEFKRHKRESNNVLQLLRYGQIFGQYLYDDLEELINSLGYIQADSLQSAHRQYFNLPQELDKSRFNHEQALVLITNSADVDAVSALEHWSNQGIKITCLPYRVYSINKQPYIQFDVRDARGYLMQDAETNIFIVNTCVRNMPDGWAYMIHNSRAAAWGDRAIGINRIKINSVVYLYYSGVGVIAKGRSISHPRHVDEREECFIDLELEWSHEQEEWTDFAVPPWEINHDADAGSRFLPAVFSISERMSKVIDNLHEDRILDNE